MYSVSVPSFCQSLESKLVIPKDANEDLREGQVKVKSLSHVRLVSTPWTVAYQASLSMGFSRQEYLSGCHCLLRFTWLFFFKYSKASYLLKSLYFSIYGSHCHFQLWHSLSIRSYFDVDLLPTKLGLAPYHIFL